MVKARLSTRPCVTVNAILSLPENMMSSPFTSWFSFTIPNALHLLAILVLALLLIRFLRQMTNVLIKPAASQTRLAQAHEQQTRALAGTLYRAGSKIIWGVAILTALPEFGISALPAVALAGLALLGLGLGAQNLVRDLIAGFHIIFEDQYVVGDTIQALHTIGRVEHLTLRRTVVRDTRGALVTLANGDIRTVGNLSRDWSQAFVDISVAPEEPLDRTLQALEAASAGLRGDPAWSQALVDGPRVLGIQAYGPSGSTLRVQLRTAPTRQDEVSRELRRRIQIEFQRQNVSLSSVQAIDHVAAFHSLEETSKPDSAS
jgi:small-conductance mechanosensitive channel